VTSLLYSSQDYVLVISAILINRNMHCHVRSLRKSRNHPVFYPFSLALSTPVPTKHACVLANSNNRWRAGGGGQGAQLECSGGRGAGEGEMGKEWKTIMKRELKFVKK